jgi:hypothetical protein
MDGQHHTPATGTKATAFSVEEVEWALVPDWTGSQKRRHPAPTGV